MQTVNRSQINVGSRLKNNDPRKAGVVLVKNVYDDHVTYWTGKRTAKISFSRIYTDGKDRHQGYNLIDNLIVA